MRAFQLEMHEMCIHARISQVCLDSLHSQIPKILIDLSRNELLCAFHFEMHIFQLKLQVKWIPFMYFS